MNNPKIWTSYVRYFWKEMLMADKSERNLNGREGLYLTWAGK